MIFGKKEKENTNNAANKRTAILAPLLIAIKDMNEEELKDKNVKSVNITVVETDKKYTYTAKAVVKTTLFVG